ncbi:unnamed protein product [Brassica oleracea]
MAKRENEFTRRRKTIKAVGEDRETIATLNKSSLVLTWNRDPNGGPIRETETKR